MKKYLFLILFIVIFASCSKNEEYGDDGVVYRTIDYKIINKTDKKYSIVFNSYKYKNDKEEMDFESLTLNPNEESKQLKTKYKYANILCIYEKDLGDGMKPQSVSVFYPSRSTFYELKEGEVNIIELE